MEQKVARGEKHDIRLVETIEIPIEKGDVENVRILFEPVRPESL